MNRREMLTSLAACAAATGVTATASAIEAEPKPLLLVLTVPRTLNCEQIARLRKEWDECQRGIKDLPRIVVLQDGMTLEAVLDPRHVPPDEIVSATNGDRGRVYDAHGNEIFKCIEANLRTGICVVRDSDGRKVGIMRPAPLRFERMVDGATGIQGVSAVGRVVDTSWPVAGNGRNNRD